VTGAWTGSAIENTRGEGAMRLVLDQRGNAIDGTLRTSFQSVVDREGPVSGTESAGTIALTFVPNQRFDCGAAGTLTGTVALSLTRSASRLSGSYTQFTCTGVVTAVVDLARE
jgi:hypothetical protein